MSDPKPMTEAELDRLESVWKEFAGGPVHTTNFRELDDKQAETLNALVKLARDAGRLIADVRRLAIVRADRERMEDSLLAAIVERDNLRKMLEDQKLATEQALRGPLLCDECDEPLQREACGRVRACSKCRSGNLIAEEILQHIKQGREGKMGEMGTVYTRSISEDEIERWRERLNPKPVPMCQDIRDVMTASDTAKGKLIDSDGAGAKPDPLDDLFPAGTGGRC